jgi:hypothetical protein
MNKIHYKFVVILCAISTSFFGNRKSCRCNFLKSFIILTSDYFLLLLNIKEIVSCIIRSLHEHVQRIFFFEFYFKNVLGIHDLFGTELAMTI